MIKAVIIDEDITFINTLKNNLDIHFKDISVRGTAQSIISGLKIINSEKPDIVFLDLIMPDGRGFDLLECLPYIDFYVIFTTPEEQYAFQTIKPEVVIDCIVKPFKTEKLKIAIEKVKKYKKYLTPNRNDCHQPDKLKIFLDKKIPLKTSGGIELVSLKNIVRLEAMRSYCKVFLKDKRSLIYCKSLLYMQGIINSGTFFRAHKSHLINLLHVESYKCSKHKYIELSDKSHIPLARSKKKSFIEKMSSLVN